MLGSIALAHGSGTPGQASVVADLARLAQARDDSPWRPAFLDHHGPTVDEAVRDLIELGCRTIIVVPTLLSKAFHADVDIPAAVAQISSDALVRIAEPIGPDALLFDVVARHVRQARVAASGGLTDAQVIVAAAGTSNAPARAAFRDAVHKWTSLTPDLDASAAFIAGGEPDIHEAVVTARNAGPPSVVVPFTLAEGALTERARRQAMDDGAAAFLPPLGAADEVVTILLARRDACATV